MGRTVHWRTLAVLRVAGTAASRRGMSRNRTLDNGVLGETLELTNLDWLHHDYRGSADLKGSPYCVECAGVGGRRGCLGTTQIMIVSEALVDVVHGEDEMVSCGE